MVWDQKPVSKEYFNKGTSYKLNIYSLFDKESYKNIVK